MHTTTDQILQKFIEFNSDLHGHLGDIVNQNDCQDMLTFLDENEKMLHPNCFYLLVDNKTGLINWSLRLFKYMGYHDVKTRKKDLSLLEVFSWIRPEELPVFLSNGLSVYMEAVNNPEMLSSYRDSISYHIEVHMKDFKGNYFHLLQQAIPMGIDDNGRLVSHLNIYTIIADGYRPNVVPLSRLYINSSQPSNYNRNIHNGISKVFTEMEVLDFNHSHQQIIKAYKENNALTVPQLGKQLRLSENSIRKYQKDMLAKINGSFGMSFTSLKPALQSLFISRIL